MAYQHYKQTEYDWVGSIPENWEWLYLSQTCYEQRVKNVGNIEKNVLSLSYGRIIQKRNIDFGLSPKDYGTYQIVNVGNIILRLTDLQNDHKSLRTGLVQERGIITSAYTCLHPHQNPDFLQLLLHTYDTQKYFYGLGGGVRQSIGFKDIRYTKLPFPPREEQDQIVRYLDWKVSGINRLISAKKKQIALLQEQKRAVVNEAVTRGGEDWRTTKFKRFTISANTGESITKEYWNEKGNILLYTAGQQPVRTEYANFPEKWLTTKNDILVARNGAGSVHLPIIGSIYTDHVIRFVLGDIINKKYIYYSLIIGMEKVVSEANSVSLATLNKSDWENVDISFPSIAEQQKIVSYLDNQCERIDNLITKLNEEITLFTEYRTRLISDVITGKLDVRDVIVPKYEAVEDETIDVIYEQMEGDEE